MRLRLLLPLLLSLLSHYQIRAQNTLTGYVVTTSGDTLRGEVKSFGSSFGKVRLIRAGQPSVDYGPEAVRSYSVSDGTVRVSRTVRHQGTARFFEPLLLGPMSVYLGKSADAQTRFYLQSSDSTSLAEIPPLDFILFYARELQGCTELANDIGSASFMHAYPYTSAGVVALVTRYNKCRFPQQAIQRVTKTAISRVSFNLKAGLNLSDYAFAPFADTDGAHTDFGGYYAGAGIEVKTRSHFSGVAELLYSTSRSTYKLAEKPNGIPADSYDEHIRFSQLQLPIMLRYTIGRGVFQPFLNGGLALGLNFGNQSTFAVPISTTTTQAVPLSIATTCAGPTFGAGFSLHSTSFPTLQAQARYQQLSISSAITNQSQLQFDLGISFK